jgi:uncharacterized protein YjiS (DUF1127 family)
MACSKHFTTDDCVGATGTARTGSALVLRRCGATLCVWQERGRQRRALRRLDDRLLDDIGVTRAAATREAGAPFWRFGPRRGRTPALRWSLATAALRFLFPTSERRPR